MSYAACKVIIDEMVRAGARATAEQVETFTPEVQQQLIDLDLGWMTAMHLIQSNDVEAPVEVAKFAAWAAARAAKVASVRADRMIEGRPEGYYPD